MDVEARRDEFDLWIEIVDSCDGPDAELTRRQLERTGNANDAADRTGPGVGVAFARAVAEAHGGELAIESVPARGNRFILRFPLDPDLTLQTAA